MAIVITVKERVNNLLVTEEKYDLTVSSVIRAGNEGGAGGGTPSNSVQEIDGAASAGASSLYSRGDHKHAIADNALTIAKTNGLAGILSGKADAGHNHNLADLAEKSYNSLADKPIIPSEHGSLAGIGTNTHAQIDTHIGDASKHRTINDSGTAPTDLWSASKIDSELGDKADLTDLQQINLGAVLTSNSTWEGLAIELTVDGNSTGFAAALTLSSDGNCDEAGATDDTLPCHFLAIDTGAGSSKKVLVRGQICNTSWNWAPGGLIYLSETTGGLTQTSPTTDSSIVQVVGIALSADTILFDPNMNFVEYKAS